MYAGAVKELWTSRCWGTRGATELQTTQAVPVDRVPTYISALVENVGLFKLAPQTPDGTSLQAFRRKLKRHTDPNMLNTGTSAILIHRL